MMWRKEKLAFVSVQVVTGLWLLFNLKRTYAHTFGISQKNQQEMKDLVEVQARPLSRLSIIL
ncbi:MAG: hypothetical protein CL693_04275 [Cellvibrionaceae bacterium]|nr:hypothetical protein [Cellvibrionaceae bacterium]